MSPEQALAHKLERETRAREQAEQLLESKSRELYLAQRQLDQQYAQVRQSAEQLTEAQARLDQSEKLAYIGQLAAGVAHEINNPVGFIFSNLMTLEDYAADLRCVLNDYADLARACEQASEGTDQPLQRVRQTVRRVGLDDILADLDGVIRESIDGADRVRRIVQDLRDLARADKLELATEDLNELVRRTVTIARGEMKYHCEMLVETAPLPPVRCQASKIAQALMNLLMNAAEAIDGRGYVTIRTGLNENEAWIEVQDTGRGIAQEHLPRLFDPFFTTKPGGTGMGLNMAYRIVQSHGGRIDVRSKPQAGSTFRVTLPIAGPIPAKEVS